MKTVGKLSLLLALLLPTRCLARDVAIVTQKQNTASGINSGDLLKLVKSDSPRWPDGSKLMIFIGDPDSTDSRFLLEKIFKLAPAEISSFLSAHKDTFTILRSDDLVLKAVASRPGAIGVVNVYAINSAVKVLRLDGKLPLEQGYLLHGN